MILRMTISTPNFLILNGLQYHICRQLQPSHLLLARSLTEVLHPLCLFLAIAIGTSYGYDPCSSSPSKLRFGSSTSHPDLDNHSSLLSPPVQPSTGFRSLTGIRPETPTYMTTSYTAPLYMNTPSAFSNTITWSYTTPNGDAKTIHGSEDTLT